jgi:hypothetical protein
MNYKKHILNKSLILETINRTPISIINYSYDEIIKRSNFLLKQLLIFCKNNNINKKDLILFGSIVLGLKGLRFPNDLDIGIRAHYMEDLNKKFNQFKVPGSYGTQITIHDLSFIHELALPKLNGQNLFELQHEEIFNIPIISFNTWKQMQYNDPNQRDRKFLTIKTKVKHEL